MLKNKIEIGGYYKINRIYGWHNLRGNVEVTSFVAEVLKVDKRYKNPHIYTCRISKDLWEALKTVRIEGKRIVRKKYTVVIHSRYFSEKLPRVKGALLI